MTGTMSGGDTDSEGGRLPAPEAVYTPDSVEALAERWRDIKTNGEVEPIAVGAKEHIRPERVSRPWVAVETTSCDAIREVDRESGLVHVEPGVHWGDLRVQLREMGLGVQMLGLKPVSATVGGLLARRRQFEAQFERGDIRQACIGLKTTGQYAYGDAPRKASGPDLRYLAVGGESRRSVILDATLTVTAPPAMRLLTIDASGRHELIRGWRGLLEMGIRLGWAWWRRSEGTLLATAYGPDRYLKAVERRVGESELQVEVHDREAAEQRRSALERQHPDRRIVTQGRSVWAVTCPLSALDEVLSSRPGHDVVVAEWGRHRVTAWLVGLQQQELRSIREVALGARRVSDGQFLAGGAYQTIGGDDE
jgi:hypothetical protein